MSRSPFSDRGLSRSRSRTASPDTKPDGCPFLVRVFVTKNKHTPLIDFDDGRFPVEDEFQVYAWKHSTPTSMIQQLFSVFPATYRSSAARYTLRHVYVDASERGLFRSKDLINFSGRDFLETVGSSSSTSAQDERTNGGMAMDRELEDPPRRHGVRVDEKTLDDYGFLTGDLISIAVSIPEPRGPLAATGGGAAHRPNGTTGSVSGPMSLTSIRGAFSRERAARDGRESRDAPPHARGAAGGERWARGPAMGRPTQPAWRDRDAPLRAPSGSWRGDGPGEEPRGGHRPSVSDTWGRRSRSRSPERSDGRQSWNQRRRE